eukprot:NODE_10659_length_433_cov_4.486979_g6602_i1.p1 GENE.NODE_10659_length_433_cov_4.486979_g6602_i1~~NODE_10659_length_433_cov_4.486979_g6602_i1.p1  ORF type:complete len:121 (+),score=7.50 NODE_10659_length_433_cov_4.486979_g6602_i1:47-409(+)
MLVALHLLNLGATVGTLIPPQGTSPEQDRPACILTQLDAQKHLSGTVNPFVAVLQSNQTPHPVPRSCSPSEPHPHCELCHTMLWAYLAAIGFPVQQFHAERIKEMLSEAIGQRVDHIEVQ